MASYGKTKDVLGPMAQLTFGSFSGIYVRSSTFHSSGWIQKPRTVVPNAYSSLYAEIPLPPLSNAGADNSVALQLMGRGGHFDADWLNAYNKAYIRFVADVHQVRANLALTLVDYEKSWVLIGSTISTVLHAASDLRSGRFPSFLARLGVLPRSRHRGCLKSGEGYRLTDGTFVTMSNMWLSYSFGWVPLFQDVYNACQVLGNNPPGSRCKGHGSAQFQSVYYADDVWYRQTVVGRVGVSIEAVIRITSPNELLLEQLGLANPAYVLWDAVPFSFIADWFLPVGRFLQSWTDFFGLQLIDPICSELWFSTDTGQPNPIYPSMAGYTRSSLGRRMDRYLEFPQFRFNPFLQAKFGFDIWKTSISLALLCQKFSSKLRSF